MQSNETYLNHPNFGLLFRICPVGEDKELFTTLYAQRLFFTVAQGPKGLKFEPLGRSEARQIVESRLRQLKRTGDSEEGNKLDTVYRQTF